MPEKTKDYILIVDDEDMNLDLLEEMIAGELAGSLKGKYKVLKAHDGEEAVKIIEERDDIRLVLLDYHMPKLDGFGVLKYMDSHGLMAELPVIMITSDRDHAILKQAYAYGITDFILRPFDDGIVHKRIENTVKLFEKQDMLVSKLTEQVMERHKTQNLLINVLSHIVEFRNGESGMHVLHIKRLTRMMLEKLKIRTDQYPLTPEEEENIVTASALHDIGKISIPDAVLNKPGRFTDEEFQIMKGHSAAGEQILKQMPFYQNVPLIKVSEQICRWHHERYDGRGYPDGLKGDEIPIGAQIVSLADVYDALTAKRVYKDPYPHEKAIEMILHGECGTFNPLLLSILEEYSEDFRRVLESDDDDFNNDDAQEIIKEIMNG